MTSYPILPNQKAAAGAFAVVHAGPRRYEVVDRRNGVVLNYRDNRSDAFAMACYWDTCDKAGEYRLAPEPKRVWRVTGTKNGQPVTVTVDARDHNEAIRKGSHHPHMLVVRDCVLLTEA